MVDTSGQAVDTGPEPKRETTSEYEIRPYEPGDREGFLDLYSTVMGRSGDDEWFDWKYAENPYVDHVPMMVATTEEEIAGARPFFALPMSIGGADEVALQPGDTMVHPDHRRQGLFTRMTERAIERYDDRPFFFNFPNDQSRPGYLKLGWEVVSERNAYYRVENPARVAAASTDRTPIRLAGKIGTPIARAYYRLRELRAPGPSSVSVRREATPPPDELAALYRDSVPEEIHAVRDEQFYQWRFGNPDWEYTSYLAAERGKSVAAIVTGTSTPGEPGQRTTQLLDAAPLQEAPEHALAALLDRIVADHPETDLFSAPVQGIPGSVLRTFGFHSDSTPPLSLIGSTTTHVVRSLTDEWEHNGLDITDSDNWLMTFSERDTS